MNRTFLIMLVTAALIAIMAACNPTTGVSLGGQPDLAATQSAIEKTQVAIANLQSELQQTQTTLDQQVGAAQQKAPTTAPTAATEAEEGSPPDTALIDVVLEQTRQLKGDADAPVKLIMFSDFQ